MTANSYAELIAHILMRQISGSTLVAGFDVDFMTRTFSIVNKDRTLTIIVKESIRIYDDDIHTSTDDNGNLVLTCNMGKPPSNPDLSPLAVILDMLDLHS